MRFRLTSSWAMRPLVGENASGVLPNGFGLVAVCLTANYFRQIATNPCYVMVAEFYN